ncbi:MAG: 50S ribosomal protein L18 [Myxococcales bacterium]|nr:50S ribosomal protein L18 [Myxococcales bacterium]HIK84602.1 50S ribosomal protein L18 [Myxococcales bacterium]
MKKKIPNGKRRAWLARKARTRTTLERSDRVMLTVFRSSKHTYAQLVENISGKTLGSVSTRDRSLVDASASGNMDAAKKVGEAIAKIAKEKSIDQVVFNRNGFLFHGRVKAVAEGAREAGLQF